MDNRQFIGKGKRISFLASRGIRQGCPLSPLSFVLIADLLLRRLKSTLGNQGVVRAFADDTAVIIKSILSMKAVLEVFLQYSSFSQLSLNFKKTMVIPLFYPHDLQAAVEEIQALIPHEVRLSYVRKAIYLGIWLGPDSIGNEWHHISLKF